MKTRLRLRREKFAREVSKGQTYKQAASKAGYSLHSAGAIGSNLMRVPQVRARVEQLAAFADRPQIIRDKESITITIPRAMLLHLTEA